MRTKIITEDNKTFLVVQCPHNIDYAFISTTGKSLVFRVIGRYVKSNGEVIGKEGQLTGYISQPIGITVVPIMERRGIKQLYDKRDVIKYEFKSGIKVFALKIPIHSQK